MINKHLIHKKSSSLVDGAAKLPTIDDIVYGEIAINYLKDNETISIKNSADEIVTFVTSKNNEANFVNVSGDTMTGALIINSTLSNGETTIAIGHYSHAEGSYTIANGYSSHAEGRQTTANGEYSHAEGDSTIANGDFSHAEGRETTAEGVWSHAEGTSTKANGYSSHAEGRQTTANGEYSHAEGYRTITNNLVEHASGCFNISTEGARQDLSALTTDSSATLFSIGNGITDSTRKNAFEVKWNGDAYFSGDTKFDKGITANTISATTITATTFSGNATSASKLETPRTITLAGDVTGSVVFDGSGNVTLTDTIVPTYASSAAKGGAATSANKVNSALSFAAGTFAVKSFDGSAAVSVNVPTKTSDLTNDSNFVTTATDKYLTSVAGSANGTMTFAQANETPITFDSKHGHPISEVTSLQGALDGKVDDAEYNTFVTNTNTALGTKVDNATYNAYVAKTDTAIAGKAPSSHTHTIGEVTGLQGALDGKQAVGDYATNTALTNGLATKQATLVSGTNIKTINTISLLGSGDITLVTDISSKVDNTTYNAYVTKTDAAIDGKVNRTGDTMTGNLVVQGTISATTQIYSSDITLKENIDLISDEDISVVRSLSPKAYMFKEDSERRVRYGVIAQDVEATKLDELVYSDEEGIKGIDYISYLVLKCEQLQRDLNALQSKFGNI